jgi:SAM-dependent methyltransferase
MEAQQIEAWTAEKVMTLGRSYQGAAILAAAADLDLFSQLGPQPEPSTVLARRLQYDARGLEVLLNALAALELLEKSGDAYALGAGVAACLTASGGQTVLAMAQHQANCLRKWAQLARVVKTGHPVDQAPSVRGEAGDQEAFIGAMDNVSAPHAAQVIQALAKLDFRHVLDVGGASGTWTLAFLRAHPFCKATLFDLPHVIPLAERRLSATNLMARVELVAGNFMTDPLPVGADFAWVSAIIHQNSRRQNQDLFAKIFRALAPGGHIAIRDILMDETHTQPVAGALFAVNMLVATDGGSTFTFSELREDLETAGFVDAAVVRHDEGMNSVLLARKPTTAASSHAA